MNLKGSDILQNTFPDGTTVSFACDVGYQAAGGSPLITCNAGSWSPVRLKCQSEYQHLIFFLHITNSSNISQPVLAVFSDVELSSK